MSRTTRTAITAVATLAALALAAPAVASFAPKLTVSGGPNRSTRIGVVVNGADDATARAIFYVPTGYTVSTPAQGTRLGSVTATASAADLAGAVLPLTGELDAIAPTGATTAVAQACGVTPTQTWDLHMSASGQTLDIPVFVVAPAAPERAAGFAAKLVACLAPPDVPAGTPGRAAFGAKLLSATFTSSAVTSPTAAGDYRWTSLWTPYTPGQGTANVAGTVETQAFRHLPVDLRTGVVRKRVVTTQTIRTHGMRKKVKVVATVVGFASAVTENGKPAASAVITTTARGKKLGGAKGSFVMVGVKSLRVTIAAIVDSDSGSVPTGQTASPGDLYFHDLGAAGCAATPIFQGLPCIDATTGGERFTSTFTVKGFTR